MMDQFYKHDFLSDYVKKLKNPGPIGLIPGNKEDTNAPDIVISEGGSVDGGSISEADIGLNALICSLTESIDEIMKENSNMVEVLEEGSVSMKLRKAKDKVTNTIVKFSLSDKRMSEQMNDKFNRFIKIFRDSRKLSSYDKIVKNSIDLSKILKNFIGSSIIGLLIPGGVPVKLISTAIALIVKTALDKRTHEKYKSTILNDLRFEIRIVQEKIKDAEAKGDNKSKYKLMRIENQLARSIDKIKFGFKD